MKRQHSETEPVVHMPIHVPTSLPASGRPKGWRQRAPGPPPPAAATPAQEIAAAVIAAVAGAGPAE